VATIRLNTFITAEPVRCFDLSISVDVHTSSTARSGERAIAGVRSGVMALNDEVTWEARHLRRAWRFTSRIVEYRSPELFTDEMRSGPFHHWRHAHKFVAVSGVTNMIDDVDFAPPFGPVGVMVDALFLRRYMSRLLGTRNKYIKDAAEASQRCPS